MTHLRARVFFASLTMFPTSALAAEGASTVTIEAVGVPRGFETLARERELLIDIYFGGRKVGEATVTVRPGFLRFIDPAAVLRMIPNVEAAPALADALSRDLRSNSDLVCSEGTAGRCGLLAPEVAGVIFDEDHFRADLFISPKWHRLVNPREEAFLSTPMSPLSLASSVGVALSGSSETAPTYNVQNRTVIGFRNARLRSDASFASEHGLVIDTLVGEIDRPGVRYSAGLFWAPGLDLTGQRRILGVGLGTQFDTRTDRDTIRGTPLVLFLSQPAQVDVIVDGRLVASRAYEAGNNVVDPSGLPNGSYPLILRIHEANGSVREEHRFFVKSERIVPVGQTMYFAYAGVLSNTRRGRVVALSDDFFYQFGTARRISESVALDLSLIGTTRKPLIEAGAWLMSPVGRVRIAAIVSNKGDRGALLQFASTETGSMSVNFDLRRIWSKGGPLIPHSSYVETFDSVALDARYRGAGSYTQASGSLGYRVGATYVSVVGALRKDEGTEIDYSVGPNIRWPLVNVNGLQMAAQADAQVTRSGIAAYVGVRAFFSSGAHSVSSTGGVRGISSKKGAIQSKWRPVADTTAHFTHATSGATEISVAAGVTRELETTTAHAEGIVYSPLGSARGEIRHDLEGSHGTRYAVSIQTGAAITGRNRVFGGRNVTESAIIATVEGDAGNATFEVLVDDQPRGQIREGERLPLFVEPYRSYSVRIRPLKAAAVWFDSGSRQVTLYPGNVELVGWQVERLFTLFGRAVRPDGTPVTDAMITSSRGTGQSDSQGFFLIETPGNDALSFTSADGHLCKVGFAGATREADYVSVGKVVCQ